MYPSILQRITAWLCLATAILTGLAPAQGLVLCLEPDGCVMLEVAACPSACGGCSDRREDGLLSAAGARAEEQGCCACVDVELPALSQDRRIQPRAPEPAWEACLALAPPDSPRSPVAVDAVVPAPRREPPRPPERLAAIRSVVLRL